MAMILDFVAPDSSKYKIITMGFERS